MKTGFRHFVSDYRYVHDQKIWISADIQANDWLKENPTLEVVNWQAVSTGKDNQLCIVIEYKEK
jgi:hypothetical protein